ncbi:Holliday junction resolvase RuvX [Fulvivirga sp. RKSG066]|uniref:Holliday junction resolvase RuvX n=1 Tax=Fulvivirga aurantia TaxID=2529383 RepID=UPI001628DDDD|nr:Holliday junction resolvase RuvX [Fulvivirga aurantia]
MGRIIALDYGLKRTGIAATDPLKIIASPMETVQTPKLLQFLKDYLLKEEVETVVVGMPKTLDDQDTHATAAVRNLIKKLKEKFPSVNIVEEDERYTSKMALDAMIAGGMKKKDRRKKENVDKVSAALILQSYLESHGSL